MSKLTTSLVVAVGLVAFTGCKKKKEEPTTQKTVEGTPGVAKGSADQAATPAPEKTLTGADLAKRYQECTGYITSDFEKFISTCMADDFTSHYYGQEMKGTAQAKAMFESMKKAMPDTKMTPQLIMVSGRNILAFSLSTGTQSGELAMPGMPPIPATNKKVGFLYFQRLAMNDQNKATDEWGYDDPAAFMGQLGLAQKGSPPTRPAIDKDVVENAPVIAVTADDAKEKANLDVVSKVMTAFNDRKNADLMAAFTDDAVVSDQAMEKDATTKKDIEAQIKAFQQGFSDAKVSAQNTYAAGDWVVVLGKFEGTHDHDYMGIKKTGKKVSLDYADVTLLKDGKVAKVWRFHSGQQLADQLGLTPPAGSAAGSAAAPAEKK